MSNQELLKVYSAYLPYKLKMKFEGEDFEHELVGLDITEHGLKLISVYEDYGTASLDSAKPILRPLSDLTKEIEHKGRKFVPLDEIKKWVVPYWDEKRSLNPIRDWRYRDIQKLLEWHFDVFSLIDQNLAINLNEVK